MKRCTRVMMVLLTAVLLVSGLLSPMSDREANANTYNWSNWAGSQPPDKQGFKWGFPELWWYGKAKVFSYGADIQYKADDASTFWVKGVSNGEENDSYFGAVAEWGTPLDDGYIYRFSMRIPDADTLPDMITVNDYIVWEQSDGYAVPSQDEIQFTYVPEFDREIAEIYLIRELDPGDTVSWHTLQPPHQYLWESNNFISKRAVFTDSRPSYSTFSLHANTVYEGNDPSLSSSYYYNTYGQGVNYSGFTLPHLPYPTADVKVMERWLPAIEAGTYYSYPHTDVATYQPEDNSSEIDFENWSDAVIAAGTKEIALTPVLDRIHTDKGVTQSGTYKWFRLSSLLNGAAKLNKGVTMTPQVAMDKLAQAAEDMAGLAHDWLAEVPDGKVYLFEVESSANYGLYKGGLAESNIGLMPGYSGVGAGGSAAWQLVFDFIQEEFYDAILSSTQLTVQDRTKISTMANFDRAGFSGAYAFQAGADLVLHKNIHRQSLNIVTANSRGAAHAYGKEYGYDFDNWDRQYAFSYHPEEIAHSLKNYFHAGADYIMDEINTYNAADGKVTEWGKTWLEFWHYAKSHPKLGDQQVRIAVMRGLGDEWNRVGGPSSSWESPPWLPVKEINDAFAQTTVPKKWAKAKQSYDQTGDYQTNDTYLGDNNLLELVFDSFGNASRTNPDRLATGTPYGPVNFIPWDTPADKLKQYDVVMYFGRGTGITQQEADNLEAFVDGGGTLVMAAGQLRSENQTFAWNDFLGIGLGTQKSLNGLPYTLLTAPGSGQVELQLSNGDPAVVSTAYGDGNLYLFSGEWLTYWNEEDAENVLEPILANAKWLTFNQPSDWLEYMVQQKGRSWVFPIFNHGRGVYPSNNGSDHGAWSGTIGVDLAKLNLADQDIAVYKVNYNRNSSSPFSLEPVQHSVQNGQLNITMTVGQLEEIVIGPKHEVQWDFWGTTYNVNDHFSEDSVQSEPDGWEITNGAAANSAEVTEASGNRFVTMSKVDTTGAALIAARDFNGMNGRVILEASVNAPQDNTKTRVMYVDNSEDDLLIKVSLGYDGKIKVVNGGTAFVNTGLTYAANDWYNLKIDLNTETGFYDFYVNGVKNGTYEVNPVNKMDVGKVHFNLQNAYADELYFDDVKGRIALVNDYFNQEPASQEPAGWQLNNEGANNSVEVFLEDAGTGNKAVSMDKIVNGSNPQKLVAAKRSFTTLDQMAIVQTKVKAPNDNAKTRLIYVSNDEGEPVIKISFGYDGKIKVTDGGESVVETGLNYSADQWYVVKTEVDLKEGQYDLYLDHSKIGTYDLIEGKTANVSSIEFRLQNNYSDVIYFDGVWVEG